MGRDAERYEQARPCWLMVVDGWMALRCEITIFSGSRFGNLQIFGEYVPEMIRNKRNL